MAMSAQNVNSNRRSDTVCQMPEAACGAVEQYPLSSALAAFGLGLSVGIAAAYLIADQPQQQRDAGAARRLGQQMVDAMAKAVPESFSKLRR
jgi:hypothetical protein